MSEETTTGSGRINSVRGTIPLRYLLGLLCAFVLALLPLGNLLGVGSITVLGAATIPVTVGPLTLLQLSGALYFAMFAMSWDAVSGYTGQISFGHGFFFAAGGYTSALLNLEFGLDPLFTIPLGVCVAAFGGIVLGVPALRLRGPYLSLVTLVAPLVLLNVFIIFSGTFGGELGLPSPDTLFGFGLGDAVAVYYLSLALFLAIMGLLLAVTRSATGAVFTAIREDPDAVAAAGLNPAKFKIFAFVLSGAVGGLAGAAFVHTPVGNPQPSQLLVTQVNIEVIIAAILGGMGTIVGAAIGGMIVYLLPEYLSGVNYVVPVFDTPVAEIDFLLFSVIALVLLFVLPGGVLRWVLARGRDLRRLASTGDDALATDGGKTPLAQVRERWTAVLGGRNPDRADADRSRSGPTGENRPVGADDEHGGDTDERRRQR